MSRWIDHMIIRLAINWPFVGHPILNARGRWLHRHDPPVAELTEYSKTLLAKMLEGAEASSKRFAETQSKEDQEELVARIRTITEMWNEINATAANEENSRE